MATQLKGVIRRQMRLYDVKIPVILKIKEEGIEIAVAGCKISVFASWERVARACETPLNVPSFMAGKPIEFLKFQAASVIKKKAGKQ